MVTSLVSCDAADFLTGDCTSGKLLDLVSARFLTPRRGDTEGSMLAGSEVTIPFCTLFKGASSLS